MPRRCAQEARIGKEMSEAEIQRSIVQTLRALGCVVIVVNQSSQAKRRTRGTTKGAPDLIVFAPNGRSGALEVKRIGGRIAQEQADMLAAIVRVGAIAAVVTSPEEALRAFGY